MFAFFVQHSFVCSVGIAYTQWLWKTLKQVDITVSGLDAVFTALNKMFSMFHPEMLWKIKIGFLIASIAW